MSRSSCLAWPALACLWLASCVQAPVGEPVEGVPPDFRTEQALTAPPGFVIETFVSGLDQPIALDWAEDGRAFIAEKAGVVRVLRNGQLLSTPFLDIRNEVLSLSDRGLLSVAVHPQFPAQPYVYLFYVFDPFFQGQGAGPDRNVPTVALLTRYTADPAFDHERALPGSRMVLVGAKGPANMGSPACQNGAGYVADCIPIDMLYHNGGHLLFGKNGALFLTIGDGYENVYNPNTDRTQALDSLSGKLLCVNPLTGDGYADNPFYDGDLTSARSRVYAYGLRSPWRMSIHPTTGEPIVGDVGLNNWEELNSGRGANFGWPCYEGGFAQSLVQPTFDDKNLARCESLYPLGPGAVKAPLYAYDHEGTGASVIAGDHYTGSTYPAAYQGAYFFGDYSRRFIKMLRIEASGAVTVSDFASNVDGLVQLCTGPDTNLYFVNIAGGVIQRFRYAGGSNTPPQAQASAAPASGPLPLAVHFSSAGSFDADGDALTFAWTFGDGTSSSEALPVHVYEQPGSFVATLVVTDAQGGTAEKSVTITAGNSAPEARIVSPLVTTLHAIGDTITFSGEGIDLEDGSLPEAAFEWTGVMHHNDHVHYDAFHALGSTGSFVFEEHDDDSYLELCLTVKDSANLSATECVDVRPREVRYTFESEPSGLELVYDGVRRRTPFEVNVAVGAHRAISAPSPQFRHVFSAWSNGEALAHDITVGDEPMALTAHYRAGAIEVPSLVGRWALDADARDSVGQNHGTVLNGATFVTDAARGPVLSCDGVDDRVSLANSTGEKFSWSAFMRTSATSLTGTFAYQGNGLIWSDVSGRAQDFTLAVLNNRLSFFEGASNTGATGVRLLNDDRWHHVAVTRVAAGDYALYVDGVRQTGGSAGAGKVAQNPLVFFCANVLDKRFYKGLLDDVRLFDRALSADEVSALASNAVNLAPTLVAPLAQKSVTGQTVALAIASSDPDGDALEFSAQGLPPGLSIDRYSGLIAGTVNSAGTYAVGVRTTDGLAAATTTFPWLVSEPCAGATFCDDFLAGDSAGFSAWAGTFTVTPVGMRCNAGPDHKATRDGTSFANLRMEARLTLENGGDAGVVYRVLNPRPALDGMEGFYAGLDLGNQRIVLGRMDGTWHQLAVVPRALSPERAYTLAVEAQGPRHRVYVDGELVLDVTDANYQRAGLVGVRAFNAAATWDYLRADGL